MALGSEILAPAVARTHTQARITRLRYATAVYAIGCLLHVAHALAFTDPRTLRVDWHTFLAIEIAIRAPLWPLTFLGGILGLDLLPAL